jgi:glycosyltransferase involved in cell wall biosynthesis
VSNRPRVLLVSGSLPPMRCGVGDYVAGLGKALAATGELDVAVLTSKLDGRADAPSFGGFEVLEPIRHWDAASLGQALAAARSWRPDVVHVQHPSQGYDGPLPFLLGMAARWRLGKPLAATLHEPVGVNLQTPLVAGLIRSAGAVIVVRHNFRELVNWKAGWTIAGVPLRFIPNATTLPQVERTAELKHRMRDRFSAGNRAIVAYFGFIYPSRGVTQLFDIADPGRHHLVIVGGKLDEAAAYHDEVVALSRQDRWKDACTLAGFLPEREAAEVLAAADAIVLPFTIGGGSWNTSLHGARLQGTYVVTTSRESNGYDAGQNVYYARPNDIDEMRAAVGAHLGTRQPPRDVPTWERVAAEHLAVYRELLGPAR